MENELTGYEKPLEQYTQKELAQIAQKYTIYYKTASGIGKTGGYNRLSKSKLIELIRYDPDYKRKDPKNKPGRRDPNRIKPIKKDLIGRKPSTIMNIIINALQDTERSFPSSGKYYTYIYYAKTPNIIYDRYPLILASDLMDYGFYGFNYHWEKIRKYTFPEVASPFYEVTTSEFNTLRSISYADFHQT